MTGLILLGLLFVFLALGVPIAYSLAMAGVITIVGFTSINPTIFVTSAISGIDSFPLLAIPFFILAGKLMEEGKISERLVNVANLFVGTIAGGLAIVGVLACTIFGAVSGSAVATTCAIGGIMLPSMKKAKYNEVFSAALMCISGIIGALIPPSLAFVVYGAVTGVSIVSLFIAGIIPGVLLTAALAVTSYVIAKKRGYKGFDHVDRSFKNIVVTFGKAFTAVLVPVIILGGIYGGIFTPTEAGTVACLYAIILTVFIYKTLNLKGLYKVFKDSATLTIITMVVVTFASGLTRFLSLEQIPQSISNSILALSSNKYVFLLLVNIFLLFVGCIMDTTAACIVLAPIFLPIATSYGIDPIHFGVIMVFNLLLGLTTPPVGSSLFVTVSLTKIPLLKIARGLLPFYVAAAVSLILVVLIPELSIIWFK